MTAYLIMGMAGSGKSTICKALIERGFRAIDTDFEPGLSGWVNITTGRRLETLPRPPFSQEWLNNHRWRWDLGRFNQLLAEAEKSPVFFCGGADQIEDFLPQFKRRFLLIVDNITLKDRLQHREPHRFHDESAELARVLEWNAGIQDFHRKDNVTVIDTSKPLSAVVNEILQEADL